MSQDILSLNSPGNGTYKAHLHTQNSIAQALCMGKRLRYAPMTPSSIWFYILSGSFALFHPTQLTPSLQGQSHPISGWLSTPCWIPAHLPSPAKDHLPCCANPHLCPPLETLVHCAGCIIVLCGCKSCLPVPFSAPPISRQELNFKCIVAAHNFFSWLYLAVLKDYY